MMKLSESLSVHCPHCLFPDGLLFVAVPFEADGCIGPFAHLPSTEIATSVERGILGFPHKDECKSQLMFFFLVEAADL